MSENVFSVVQIGKQAGTFAAPGAAVAATYLFPLNAPIQPDLDFGATYPVLDRGRNVRNYGASGYHGVRQAGVTLPFEMRFEDLPAILEMIYAQVTPTGSNPYTWLYPFEAVTPTIVPHTIETGNTDLASAQERLLSCLVNSLTMGFSAVTPGQASPWTASAEVFAFDRTVTALTAALNVVGGAGAGLETIQGHLTQLYEGTVVTAFASLVALGSSLRSFTMTPNRNLFRRSYGSASDIPIKYGFTDLSGVTFELVVAVSATAKTDFHDVWNTSGGASLGERRIRIQALGSGSKKFTIDARAGLFVVPWDEGDGERVYRVTGEFADDATLAASHTVEVVNTIAALP